MSCLPVFVSSQAYCGPGTHFAVSNAQSVCLQLSDCCLTHITQSSQPQLGIGHDTMSCMSKGCMVVLTECCHTCTGSIVMH